MPRHKILLRLLGMLRSLWGVMIFSISMRVLNQSLGIAILTYGAWQIGLALKTGGLDLQPLLVTLVLMGMAKGVFRYLEQFTGHYVAFHILALLRSQLYQKLEPLAPAGLADARSGDVISRAIADVDRIEVFYAHTIAPAAAAVLVPTLALIALGQFHPLFVWAFLPFLLGVGLLAPWLSDYLGSRFSLHIRPLAASVSAHLTDSIQGLREIVAFGYGEHRQREIWDRGQALTHAQERLARVTGLQNALSDALIGLGILSVILTGLDLEALGQLDIYALPAVLALATTVFVPVLAASNVIHEFNQAISGAGRLFALMDTPPVVLDLVTRPPAGEIQPSLAFDSVSFTYPARGASGNGHLPPVSAPALVDVSFEIPAGSIAALVGASGAGKSTIINLIVRFWDVERGHIRLGGYDVRDFPLADLRQRIAVVSQRTHIFNSSIRENLLLGNPAATQSQIEHAARLANIHDFIQSLPEGYETVVGEMGVKLSGGQRQRLAIARALLKDAPILLLDEATSNLDAENEREIQAALAQLMAGRTTLIIAHRLSTVVHADLILVLENGRLVEQGNHRQLLARGGVYARFLARQQEAL